MLRNAMYACFSWMLFAVVGCSDPSSASAGGDARPVLTGLSKNVFVPTVAAATQSAALLQTAVQGWDTAEPNAQGLADAQAAWRRAHADWRRADAFRFGPVDSLRVAAAVDFTPTNTASLSAWLEGTEAITAESVELLGANQKGFGGLEFVLFDTQGSAAVLAQLSGTTGARRRLFVKVATAALHTKLLALKEAWGEPGTGFAREVAEAGAGGSTFPSAQSAVDQIVNSAIFAAELVTNTKLAKPAGKKTGGVPQPADVESARSDQSLADMLATLEGVHAVYTGAPGTQGISMLVRPKNASLDDRVEAAFSLAEQKISAIPAPFRTAIVDHPAEVEAAYQAMKALKNSLSTEVASTLGTTLKFNDNDGD